MMFETFLVGFVCFCLGSLATLLLVEHFYKRSLRAARRIIEGKETE
jgi:hypothetical protein